MISAVRKEVFESGHVRDRRGRRDVQEGANVEGSSLSAFMHATACEKLMPLLSTNCKATHQQVRCQSQLSHIVIMSVFFRPRFEVSSSTQSEPLQSSHGSGSLFRNCSTRLIRVNPVLGSHFSSTRFVDGGFTLDDRLLNHFEYNHSTNVFMVPPNLLIYVRGLLRSGRRA